MTTSELESDRALCTNLADLVKKILLAFCEVNVSFSQRLDIYGSIHVRSDDSDVTCFLLNEHCYRHASPANDIDAESVFTRHVSSRRGSVSCSVSTTRNVVQPDRSSGGVGNIPMTIASVPIKKSSNNVRSKQFTGGNDDYSAARNSDVFSQRLSPGFATNAVPDQSPSHWSTKDGGNLRSGGSTPMHATMTHGQPVFPEPVPTKFEDTLTRSSGQLLPPHSSASVVPTDSAVADDNDDAERNRDAWDVSEINDEMDDDDSPPSELTDEIGVDIRNSSTAKVGEADGQALVKVEPSSGDVLDFESEDDLGGIPERSPSEGGDDYKYGMLSQSYSSPGAISSHQLQSYSGTSRSGGYQQSDLYAQAAWLQSSLALQQMAAAAPLSVSNAITCIDRSPSVQQDVKPSDKICGYCMKSFSSGLQLRIHIQRQHIGASSSALDYLPSTVGMVSPQSVPTRIRRQHHLYTSSPIDIQEAEKFSCSVCSQPFRSLDGLRCHENSKHSRNKLYRCQFCTQAFLTRQAAYTHRIKFHRVTPKKTGAQE